MRTHINHNTAPRVPDSGPERARQGQCNVPAGLVAALLCAAGLADATDARAVGETTRVSVSSSGMQGRFSSNSADMSADGRCIALQSTADNLVPGDTNHANDVFVHDRQTGRTRRVSVDSTGNQANADSDVAVISANGRFVAFSSFATNLVLDDINSAEDVFVHDRFTRQTSRISIDSTGAQGNNHSFNPAISADGRYVAFTSAATNLVPGDTNRVYDVFVHDQQTHRTTRISIASTGDQGDSDSRTPALSADGRFVAFSSDASNFVFGDNNNVGDVFVHDRATHETSRVSIDSAGQQASSHAYAPALSSDGRVVAFVSYASNLVPGDTNNQQDVFVHDRLTHQTTRVSVSSSGRQGNGYSLAPWLSGDGRFVAFSSDATNLISLDTNRSTDGFVHDRQTHQTTRISVDSMGNQGDHSSGGFLQISAEGRFVAFWSNATNLVAGDTNSTSDIFVRDRLLDRSASADLAISQTVSPDPFLPLSPLTYTLTAVNHGPDAATDVTVNDRPALLSGTVVSVVPSQGSCSQGAPFVCYLGTLAPGASSTIAVTVQPKWRDTVSLWNTAHVNAAPVDGNVANNQSTLRTDVAP